MNDQPTTPEPVSPAPDTEALRQQVAAVLEERIGDNSDLYETVDDVLALPWIKYAAGQRHVVTMHEQNNAAIAETNRQIAEENAGLRADLDRDRAERDELTREVERLNDEVQSYQGDGAYERGHEHGMNAQARSCVRDLLDALQLGPMPDRPLDTVWTTLLKIVSEQEANRHATAMAGVRDRLEVKRLRAELARVSGDRTIPDDAAERRALMARFDALLAERDFLDEDDQLTVLHVFESLLADLGATPTTDHLTWSVVHVPPGTTDPEDRDTPITPGWWVLGVDSEAPEHPVVQVHLGETLPPTTGPAPAAADVQWGVRFSRGDVRQSYDEGAARAYVDWHNKDNDAKPVAVVSRTISEWLPAAPQAPAEPKKQCTWWWDTKQCPDWAAPGGKYCDGHQRDHNDLLREVPEAAREDTEPPDADGYNSDLTAGFLRPSAPTEEV